jgi:hypothetical protein
MAKLLLFDPDLREFAPFIGRVWSIGADSQQGARTLKEFAAALHKEKELEEAVLFFHGIPGGIDIGGKVFNLSDKELKDALTAKRSKIARIRFEGCWVGERPDEMAQFGSYFNAAEMLGYTWEGVRATTTVSLPKGADAATIRRAMGQRERWLAPGSPSVESLVGKARDRAITEKFLVEWFESVVADPIKPPYETQKGDKNTNFDRLGSKQYKRRNDAGSRTVKAKDLEEISSDPISLFEYVTVTA